MALIISLAVTSVALLPVFKLAGWLKPVPALAPVRVAARSRFIRARR